MGDDACSPNWAVRTAAGLRLAAAPDLGPVGDTLLGLILDQDNTGVTWEVARAVLARRDQAGLALVLRAAGRAGARADDPGMDGIHHTELLDHRYGALSELEFLDLEQPGGPRDRCEALLEGADDELTSGIRWYLRG